MKNKNQFQINNNDKEPLVVIAYLIEKLNNELNKDELKKLLFLTHLLSIKKFKKSILEPFFKTININSYDKHIYKYIKHLEDKNLIITDQSNNSIYKYIHKNSVKKTIFSVLDNNTIMLIDNIIDSYKNYIIKDIIDIVYEMQFTEEQEKYSPLNTALMMEQKTTNMPIIDWLL